MSVQEVRARHVRATDQRDGNSHHVTADHIIEIDGDSAHLNAQFIVFEIRATARPAGGWARRRAAADDVLAGRVRPARDARAACSS